MAYAGVKFTTVFEGRLVPAGPALEELKAWCRRFHELGLAPPYEGGSYGNLSFRVRPGGPEFVVTGTRIGLKDALPDEAFVTVLDVDAGRALVRVSGAREPSSEAMLHQAVYARRPEICAIFHGHAPRIVAAAPALGIPVTAREEPYGTAALAESLLAILDRGDFLILRGHGFVALGRSQEEAGRASLEMLARCPQTDPARCAGEEGE